MIYQLSNQFLQNECIFHKDRFCSIQHFEWMFIYYCKINLSSNEFNKWIKTTKSIIQDALSFLKHYPINENLNIIEGIDIQSYHIIQQIRPFLNEF